MCDVISKNRGNVHAMDGVEDPIHLLIEMPKIKTLSNVIRDVKTTATRWIKGKDELKSCDLEWQTGYGGFTMSYSTLDVVKKYIANQDEHHHKQTAKEEWDESLKKCVYL